MTIAQMYNKANAIIDAAQRGLGPLSAGQKRDLLRDNTDWNEEDIVAMVEARMFEDAGYQS